MQRARYTQQSITVAALVATVAFSACGRIEEDQALGQVKKPFGAGSPKTANTALEDAVKEKFDTDEQLRTAHLIVRADVTRNQVTLAGQLPTLALKHKALELAKGAHAGVVVVDNIVVRPNTSKALPRRSAVA